MSIITAPDMFLTAPTHWWYKNIRLIRRRYLILCVIIMWLLFFGRWFRKNSHPYTGKYSNDKSKTTNIYDHHLMF